MIYKVVVLLPTKGTYGTKQFVVYEGLDKEKADAAWEVTFGCGNPREYYEGTISWERTKAFQS